VSVKRTRERRERVAARERVKLPSLVSASEGSGTLQVQLINLLPGPFLRKGSSDLDLFSPCQHSLKQANVN
jgi:hypothetical protein